MGQVPAARIDRIVDAAMLLDAERRELFISSACAGETGLREAIEAELARRVAGSGPRTKDVTQTMPSSAPPIFQDAKPASSGSLPTHEHRVEGAVQPHPPRSDAPLARGATLGRYIVLDALGRGAMGVVYAAYDP